MESISFRLYSYFVNVKALMSVVNPVALKNIERSFSQAKSLPGLQGIWLTDRTMMDEVANYICTNKTKTLEELLLDSNLSAGQLITTDRTFTYKGVSDADRALEKGRHKPGKFYLKLKEFNDVEVFGEINAEHLTCNSATGNLSNQSRKFIFAIVEDVSSTNIQLKPIVIADRVVNEDIYKLPLNCSILYRSPELIDEFCNMRKIDPRRINIDEMQQYSEAQIKTWIAEIIGERDIPKDWGGENSDLYAMNLHIEGEPMRAAFAFKGLAKFHKMEVKDLGKNGDQIVRLFNEPADIFIVQHCHFISPGVVYTMDAFASRYYQPSYYSVINGIDTLRILKAYGKIK